MPILHTVLFTRESQYLTGPRVCELAQAAHFDMGARKPRHEQESSCLPGIRVLAQSAVRGPTVALPLGDKVSKRKRGDVWFKKGTH